MRNAVTLAASIHPSTINKAWKNESISSRTLDLDLDYVLRLSWLVSTGALFVIQNSTLYDRADTENPPRSRVRMVVSFKDKKMRPARILDLDSTSSILNLE